MSYAAPVISCPLQYPFTALSRGHAGTGICPQAILPIPTGTTFILLTNHAPLLWFSYGCSCVQLLPPTWTCTDAGPNASDHCTLHFWWYLPLHLALLAVLTFALYTQVLVGT